MEGKLWAPAILLFFHQGLFALYLSQIPANLRHADYALFSSFLLCILFSMKLSLLQFQTDSKRKLFFLTFAFKL